MQPLSPTVVVSTDAAVSCVVPAAVVVSSTGVVVVSATPNCVGGPGGDGGGGASVKTGNGVAFVVVGRGNRVVIVVLGIGVVATGVVHSISSDPSEQSLSPSQIQNECVQPVPGVLQMNISASRQYSGMGSLELPVAGGAGPPAPIMAATK